MPLNSLNRKADITIGGVDFQSEISYRENEVLRTTVTFTKEKFDRVLKSKDNNLMRTFLCGADPAELAAMRKEAAEMNHDAKGCLDDMVKFLASYSSDLSDEILGGTFDFKDGEKKDYVIDWSLKNKKATYKFGNKTLLVISLSGQEEFAKVYMDALASIL